MTANSWPVVAQTAWKAYSTTSTDSNLFKDVSLQVILDVFPLELAHHGEAPAGAMVVVEDAHLVAPQVQQTDRLSMYTDGCKRRLTVVDCVYSGVALRVDE